MCKKVAWFFAQLRVKAGNSMLHFTRDGSATATSDLDKANLFNHFFASCFNPTCVPPSYSSLGPEDVGPLDSFDVVPAEVANQL